MAQDELVDVTREQVTRADPNVLLNAFRSKRPGLKIRKNPTASRQLKPNSAIKADVHIVPFFSGTGAGDEIVEGRFNSHFYLRVYLPPNNVSVEQTFVFLNGFAEATTAFWDTIGGSLAEAGAASILLPLPYHFSRNVFFNIGAFDDDDPFRLNAVDLRLFTAFMKEDLVMRPERFLSANQQIISDLGSLAIHLNNPGDGDRAELRDFVEQNLSKSKHVTLVGYSLGGLCALQRFLSQPDKFEACILLNSGASFQDMNGSSMFDDAEHRGRWLKLLRGLLAEASKRKETFSENLFSHVILGHSKVELHDKLVKNRHKLLFLIGGTDPIINFRNMANLEPLETGLAIFQIPGLKHFINIESLDGKEWEPWSKVAVQLMLTFVQHHPDESALTHLRGDTE